MPGNVTKAKAKSVLTDVLRVEDIIIEDGSARIRKGPEFDQLVESVKATEGILQPIIVRPHPKSEGKFQLLAGRRRCAATKAAGFDFIKAEIYDVDDRGAMLIMVTENLQRKDLTPLEEAANLKKLIDAGKDTKAIAADLGRSESWVVRRARLIALTPTWIKVLQDPRGSFRDWSVGHMELIARFDPERQSELLEDFKHHPFKAGNCRTAKDLNQLLGEEMRLIRKAPWKLDDESLNSKAGACTSCPRRSSHQPILFDDDLTEEKIKANDKCLDISCWDIKVEAHLDRRIPELQQTYPNLILIAAIYRYEGGKYKEVYDQGDFLNVKKKDKGALPAIVVAGPGTGELRWVRLGSWVSDKKAARPRGADGKPKPASKEERYKKLQNRRNAHIVNALREILNGDTRPVSIIQSKSPLSSLMAITTVFGTCSKKDYPDYKSESHWKEFIRLSEEDEDLLVSGLWKEIAPVFYGRLAFSDGAAASQRIPEAKHICKLIGFDFNTLKKQSEKDILVPKSWAKLDTPAMRKVKKTAKKPAKKSAKKKKKVKRVRSQKKS